MERFLVALVLLVATSVSAGTPVNLGSLTVDPGRLIDWSLAGVQGGIPDTSGWTVENVTCNGSSDSATIQSAINSAAANTIIQLPSGTCYIENTADLDIDKSYLVIRGAGQEGAPTGTTLSVGDGNSAGCGGSNGVIKACGIFGTTTNLGSGYSRGSSSVVAASSGHGLANGDWAVIKEYCSKTGSQNYCYSALESGDHKEQLVQITAVDGTEISFTPPLRNNYGVEGGTGQKIQEINAIEHVGFEDMRFEHRRTSGWGGAPLTIQRAVNSWVTGCTFYRPYRYAITLRDGGHHTFQSNVIDEMGCREAGVCDYAGHYAVSLKDGPTDNLIVNNAFHRVYIPVIMHNGANGNVVAHNYFDSTNDRCSHGIFFHGGYPSANLIEGNDIDCSITLDSYWGQQGPYNTFFRNRLRGDDHIIRGHADFGDNRQIASFVNVLANHSIGYAELPFCYYYKGNCRGFDRNIGEAWLERNLYEDARSVADCTAKDIPYDCCYGNGTGNCKFGLVLEGQATAIENFGPASTAPASWDHVDIPESLWTLAKPSWWCEESAWPATGAGAPRDGELPAQRLYEGKSCTTSGSQTGSPPGSIPAAPFLLAE